MKNEWKVWQRSLPQEALTSAILTILKTWGSLPSQAKHKPLLKFSTSLRKTRLSRKTFPPGMTYPLDRAYFLVAGVAAARRSFNCKWAEQPYSPVHCAISPRQSANTWTFSSSFLVTVPFFLFLMFSSFLLPLCSWSPPFSTYCFAVDVLLGWRLTLSTIIGIWTLHNWYLSGVLWGAWFGWCALTCLFIEEHLQESWWVALLWRRDVTCIPLRAHKRVTFGTHAHTHIYTHTYTYKHTHAYMHVHAQTSTRCLFLCLQVWMSVVATLAETVESAEIPSIDTRVTAQSDMREHTVRHVSS